GGRRRRGFHCVRGYPVRQRAAAGERWCGRPRHHLYLLAPRGSGWSVEYVERIPVRRGGSYPPMGGNRLHPWVERRRGAGRRGGLNGEGDSDGERSPDGLLLRPC